MRESRRTAISLKECKVIIILDCKVCSPPYCYVVLLDTRLGMAPYIKSTRGLIELSMCTYSAKVFG